MAKKTMLNDEIISVPELYTNIAKVSYSNYEFEILFGLVSSNYEGLKPLLNLRTSPQFLKAFANLLLENIDLFEKNIGSIDLIEKK